MNVSTGESFFSPFIPLDVFLFFFSFWIIQRTEVREVIEATGTETSPSLRGGVIMKFREHYEHIKAILQSPHSHSLVGNTRKLPSLIWIFDLYNAKKVLIQSMVASWNSHFIYSFVSNEAFVSSIFTNTLLGVFRKASQRKFSQP